MPAAKEGVVREIEVETRSAARVVGRDSQHVVSFDVFFKLSFFQSTFSGSLVVTGGFLVKSCA